MAEILKQRESENILAKLKKEKAYLQEKYNVKKLGIFGSIVRNEQSQKSDIDILVEFSEPISLFKFIEMEEYLGKVLTKKVDVVMKKALKPRLKKQILKEVKYL